MTNPITDLLGLSCVPAALSADVNLITETMRSVRTVETMLASPLGSRFSRQ